MNTRITKSEAARILAQVFGVQITPSNTRLEKMNYSRVNVIEFADDTPEIAVIGIDGTWTFSLEFAQDGSGDIEAYAAGEVLSGDIVAKIAQADALLNGFVVGGLRMFILNPDYDREDRALAHKLMDAVEAIRGRPQRPQA